MIKYCSFMKPMIEDFIKYRSASQHWNEVSYGQNLKTFENYCIKNFPTATSLTQEMVDDWCTQRKTEQNISCATRICVIISFLKYTNSRNLTNLNVPEKPIPSKKIYIPHAFTEDELKKFFYACDNVEMRNNTKAEQSRILEIPIFFRLLYSTGMRTTEARLLKRKNVDITNKIINIEETKGYDQHYVPIHESLIKMLIDYDKKIDLIYPNREYFFSNSINGFHGREWVWKNFKEMWTTYNESYAVAYDLRHHYAISNINKWVNEGFDFNQKLYYLGKSMGHKTIESTKYYYAITPRISDIFKNQVNTNFETVIPEVNEDE